MTTYIIIGAFALSIYLIFFRWPKKAATEPEPFQPRIQSTVHPKNCENIKYPGYNGKNKHYERTANNKNHSAVY